MPRKPRIEYAGFHHIINRGVARSDIFLKDDDYIRFLEIVENAKKTYNFHVHSLCLMTNHYHLLLETHYDNLSMIARQINSKYAQYFNIEYKRVGPLWQGRFKSTYVHDEIYLSTLVRYIEQNPIKAEITKHIGQYRWSASTLLQIDTYDSLFRDSLLHDKKLLSLLEVDLNEEDENLLHELANTTYKRVDDDIVKQKQKQLSVHFLESITLHERNRNILNALADGYTQGEIARYLKLTSSAVSYIVNNLKFDT